MKKDLLFLLILPFVLIAQTVYEPINNSIYEFLDIQANKGNIIINNIIKPISRKYIAEKLLELKNNESKLTAIQKQELDYYIKDYKTEINFVKNTKDTSTYFSYFAFNKEDRFHCLQYDNTLLKIKADFILGYSLESKYNKKYTHRWNGASVTGYLSDNIGFMFNFRDNREESDYLDPKKALSPETGIDAISRDNGIDFSEARASLSYNWNWGTITFAKDYLTWGNEKSGNVVLGTKAPTYPYFRLDIQPADWIHFNYVHAFLDSKVIDSNESYKIKTYRDAYRTVYREKYLASHTLTLIPTKGLNLSLGESIIYTDKLKPLYLLPVMFFRLADHYYSNIANDAGDNAQFFLNITSKNQIQNTSLYATWYIDELTVSKIFDRDQRHFQCSLNFGTSVSDLFLDNLTLTAEYTRIFPFAYQHYMPANTYQSSGYTLGHWLGDNGDLLYFSANYKLRRGLDIQAWCEFMKKGNGGLSDSLMRYWEYNDPQPEIFWGKVTTRTFAGLTVKYEVYHDLVIKFNYEYSFIKDDLLDESRTYNYQRGTNNNFGISVYYGL